MQILFTTTDSIFSRMIRKITNEPVSHCALRVGEFVIHSTALRGVVIEPYDYFKLRNKIKFKLNYLTEPLKVRKVLNRCYQKPYDFGGLIYLGLRFLFPKIMPKQNLWQTTGMFLCTEFISVFINQEENSMITPYKLYTELFELGDDNYGSH